MILPKWATTVTPLSKALALIIFITFPIFGFVLGMKYQQIVNTATNNISPTPIVPQGIPCTLEAKICPDGSAVGRTGPNCEFALCHSGITQEQTAPGENNSCAQASRNANNDLPRMLMASPDYLGKTGALGKGYLVYTVVDLQNIKGFTANEKVSSIISPSSLCYFAVLMDNQPTTDLYMEKRNSIWVASAVGGAITVQINDLEKQLPSLLQQQGLSGQYSLKLVRVYSLNLVFVLVEDSGKEFIISLAPSNWFGLTQGKLYTVAVAMPYFVQSAKQQLDNKNPTTVGQ